MTITIATTLLTLFVTTWFQNNIAPSLNSPASVDVTSINPGNGQVLGEKFTPKVQVKNNGQTTAVDCFVLWSIGSKVVTTSPPVMVSENFSVAPGDTESPTFSGRLAFDKTGTVGSTAWVECRNAKRASLDEPVTIYKRKG